MLVSTPTKSYHPDSSPRAACVPTSPTYSRYTPPRPSDSQYDSPMSPFRPNPLFSGPSSPYSSSEHRSHSTAQAHFTNPFSMSHPQPIVDEDGAIFLSPRQPLLTPAKPEYRPALAARTNNADALSHRTSAGAGTKRKSTPLATPLRPNTLTPLKITQSAAFDRLAPLPAPKFNTRTPQTKGETDVYLTRQTATLTRLRLSDRHGSDGEDDFCGPANDSGCEVDEDDTGHGLFLSNKPLKALAFHAPHVKGKGKDEEVAEAVSPGGHITKRRARSRPLSSDLLEYSFKAPPSPTKQSGIPCRVGATRPRHSGPVTFPSTAHRGKMSPGSTSSSSEAGSPRPRRRKSAGSTASRSNNTGQGMFPPRPPLSRIDSVSAATLFFGPTIPQKKPKNDENIMPPLRHRTSSSRGSEGGGFTPSLRQPSIFRPPFTNRHSYAGPDDRTFDLKLWNTTRNDSPSPGSSPFAPAMETPARRGSLDMDDDEDMFFGGETSFEMSVTHHSPSPTRKLPLPMKYKRRGSTDEEDLPSTESSSLGADGSHMMPKASMSVSSFCSEEGLMTPGVAPEGPSGWPSTSIFVSDNEETMHPYGGQGIDVDAFIQKTLADASSKASSMPKRAPGTPVKKARPVFFGNDRPWQSAVATSKVGLKEDSEYMKKATAAPRKSMPAAFGPGGTSIKAPLAYDRQNQNPGTETDDEEEYSPSVRREKYVGLGLGQPGGGGLMKNGGTNGNAPGLMSRKSWLLRRSSSGAFSSGSDSASLSSTPTRVKGIDWQLKLPTFSGDATEMKDAKGFTRSTSGSSSSSVATLHSPTTERKRPSFADSGAVASVPGRHNAPRMSAHHAPMRFSEGFAEDAQPGRFERDFEEIEEVGSGEFGKVIKVQSKMVAAANGDDDHGIFAIKRSKRFEGVKHRLRLREEVDILKHLSQAALTFSKDGRHPNVLAYVDSWEEDEALFIQTELCESGNLARFLWEYGRAFPRLDESRVWKIIVDLSNGLRFIHDSGVIHLDLKPSNVFLTKEGSFKIGDFGMASLWPRPIASAVPSGSDTSAVTGACAKAVEGDGFEREGDKLYLAPEVLQGRYSKAADVFSFGMTMLEVAANVVVPDQGDGWQRLRHEDFSQVDLDDSPELLELIRRMMRTDPAKRVSIEEVWSHPVVTRARQTMDALRAELVEQGESTWLASPLAKVPTGFLEDILGREDGAMDTSM